MRTIAEASQASRSAAGTLAALLAIALLACGREERADDAPDRAAVGDPATARLASADAAGSGIESMTEGEIEPVRMTLEPRLQGPRLFLSGRANLPDGTILPYEIAHEGEGVVGDPEGEALTRTGTLRVHGGAYEGAVDLSGMPAGRLQIWLLFQTRLGGGLAQPEAVLDRYGSRGERLRGPQVSLSDDERRVIELSDTLDYAGG